MQTALFVVSIGVISHDALRTATAGIVRPTARLANIGRVESDILYFPFEPTRI